MSSSSATDVSSESSDSEESLVVFRRVKKAAEANRDDDIDKRRSDSIAIANSNAAINRLAEPATVDDTDGINPEEERKSWEIRERRRIERDLKEMELAEEEIQEKMERRAKRLKRENQTDSNPIEVAKSDTRDQL